MLGGQDDDFFCPAGVLFDFFQQQITFINYIYSYDIARTSHPLNSVWKNNFSLA